MQIIFIHHSCFLVELDDKVLIFDYFDGDKVEGMHFTVKLVMLLTGQHSLEKHCHRGRIRSAATQRRYATVFRHALKTRNHGMRKDLRRANVWV